MAKKKANDVFARNSLKLKEIKPKTDNQGKIFEEYKTDKHLFIDGCPGTGKSFLACYLAIKQIMLQMTDRRTLAEGQMPFRKIIILRSVVPSRDMGFLPGSVEEKAAVYEMPYINIFQELFGRFDAYELLKEAGVVEFVTTSFLRGLTFNDAIVIVDECQNENFNGLNTVITRIGDNSKIIFCGDYYQTDLNKKGDLSGFVKFKTILQGVDDFRFIHMDVKDIVRSLVVKKWIIARIKWEDSQI